MPIWVLAALILMAAFDMSINLMSLGGLVVGIGMMVDSSIVVIDSCFKSTEDGLDYVDAVHVGANLVFSSIVASTATTVVVFLCVLAAGFDARRPHSGTAALCEDASERKAHLPFPCDDACAGGQV